MQQSETGDTYIKGARMLDYNELIDYLKAIFTDYDLAKNKNKHDWNEGWPLGLFKSKNQDAGSGLVK